MPLPNDGATWPPNEWSPIFADMRTFAAWWSGDPRELRRAYQQSGAQNATGQRMFWNRMNNDPGKRPSRTDLHIPIASDLCATSADLVYGQMPNLASDHGAEAETSRRLTQYVEDGIQDELLTGAEFGAAMGGRYHSVVFDETINDSRPFITTIKHDHAIPYFQWGHLKQVTFWSEVARDNAVVWRHVEHHELNGKNGVTLHGLYEGTFDNLGKRVPLGTLPATEPLTQAVDETGALRVQTPGLGVVYIPNVKPNRMWQGNPIAENLGRSDLENLPGLMDALDETYNSWMRDVRLAKARVFIDQSLMERPLMSVKGQPLTSAPNTFDLDQELFVPLPAIGALADGSNRFMRAEQFQIRTNEHLATAEALTARIVRAARYSAATFDDRGNTQMTATEIRAREKSTVTTRNRKIALEQRGLLELLRKMLTIDTAILNTPGLAPENVQIQFPDYDAPTIVDLAQTVKVLRDAQAVSNQTALALVHPDWTPDQISEELDRIREDKATITSPDMWRPTFPPEEE